MQRILAMGGFSNKESELLAFTHIRDLIGKTQPKVCLLATPAGDPPNLINHVDSVFGSLGCETSNVSFFNGAGRQCIRPEDAAAHLLEQDAVFVSGGNPRSALALWREWKLDAALKAAWERGVLLSGMSAGAICWFEHHVPPAEYRGVPVNAYLGFLPGHCEVHYHMAEGGRWEDTLDTACTLGLQATIAIDDDAAVLFEGEKVASVVSWRDGATAYHLEARPDAVFERPLVVAPRVIGSIALTREREPAAVDLDSKQACVGRYRLMSPMPVSITLEGEQLFAQYGRQAKHEIFPESENRYFWKVVDAHVTFERDDDGNVISFVHHQNGRDSHGVKLRSKPGNNT